MEKNAQIICQINNKGGVGKTTTTNCLSQILALLGKKVLTVDDDGQASLSASYGCKMNDSEEIISGTLKPAHENIHELYLNRYRSKDEVHKCIYQTDLSPNIHIIPSSKRHVGTENALFLNANRGNVNIILKKALDAVRDEYDYILIDTPPAQGFLTTNAIFASDFIITPIQLCEYSKEGLFNTLKAISDLKEEYGIDNPKIKGVFITQDNPRTNRSKKMKDILSQELGSVFIPFSIVREDKMNNLCEENVSIVSLMKGNGSTALVNYCQLLLYLDILDDLSRYNLLDLLAPEQKAFFQQTINEHL